MKSWIHERTDEPCYLNVNACADLTAESVCAQEMHKGCSLGARLPPSTRILSSGTISPVIETVELFVKLGKSA
jgi:hypothetical protein